MHNPLDLTPMTADAPYEAVVRAVMDDPGVDLGVVGCVPLTGALATLAAGPGHGEDLTREGSVVQRLVRLRGEIAKPWVAVVDAGALYDPMARALDEAGIPTFRSADRALRRARPLRRRAPRPRRTGAGRRARRRVTAAVTLHSTSRTSPRRARSPRRGITLSRPFVPSA